MISPLVYIFAGAAGVLALFFVASALLTYRHASTRSERARDLQDYLAGGGAAKARKQRARVMQVTIGDLIRDDKLAEAVEEGTSAAAATRWTPVVGPFFRIDRTESGQYMVEVRVPGRPVIKSLRETEAEARAWAEQTVWQFEAESGPGESHEPR